MPIRLRSYATWWIAQSAMPIDHRRGALGIAVLDDVRGLQQRRLAQRTYGAPTAVGVEHEGAEAVLVQTHERLARRVAADLLARGHAGRGQVRHGEAGLELDELALGDVAGHEDRRDRRVLPRRNALEVDERDREHRCLAQRAVVRFRTERGPRGRALRRAVVVDEAARRLVEPVFVWRVTDHLRRRGRERQRRRAAQLPRPEDSAVEGAERHPLAAEVEAGAQHVDRDDVVVAP
jgi:hypothetical protein